MTIHTIRKISLALAAVLASASASHAWSATINVPSEMSLQDAINSVGPGDEIVIAANTTLTSSAKNVYAYPHDPSKRQWSFFQVNDIDGTASNPIVLRGASADPANFPTLQGAGVSDGKYVMHFYKSNYWIVKNIKISDGQKGIILDNSHHNQFDNIEVAQVGQEGFHFRTSSTNNVLKNCHIHHTGRKDGGYGEGVYVGWHDGHQLSVPDNSDDNLIGGCTFGPGITAEAFDVKGGTSGTVIEHNYIDGTDMGTNETPAANSFIDLKGTNVTIRHNTMEKKNSGLITHAILTDDEHQRSNIHDNTIHLSPGLPTFTTKNNFVHVKNNQRESGGIVISNTYNDNDNIVANSIYGSLANSAGSVGSYAGFGSSNSGSSGSGGGGQSTTSSYEINASAFDYQQGVNVSGTDVTHFDAGDQIQYHDIDFNGLTKLKITYAAKWQGKKIEIRKNWKGGPLVASYTLPTTGAWDSFQNRWITLTAPQTGTAKLVIVGVDSNSIMNLRRIRFIY